MDPVREMANAVRVLAMDAVEQAQSGHPGMPMGFADVATVLWREYLKYDASTPDWPDRDRFVLSAGHGSMLLYALLHLTGYPGWDIGTLKRFRQLGSPAAGHPEFGHGAGIETTTGPLGQGIATAVGMAIAEEMDRARFGAELVDHRTWVVAGDGCLMEGVSQEAITLAGHLKLSRLTVLFDDNRITIDGDTSLTTREDQPARFAAAGWHVLQCSGHDPVAIREVLNEAKHSDLPTLIAFRTMIGFGAGTKAGTEKCHGSPLGSDHIDAARHMLQWPHAPFDVPESIAAAWSRAGARGAKTRKDWESRLSARSDAEQAVLLAHISGDLETDVAGICQSVVDAFVSRNDAMATRVASGQVLEALTRQIPQLVGGSADLTGSVNTSTDALDAITPGDFNGRFMHWGIREHGMAAAMNGMALHGGWVPFAGTFLVFAGYMMGAMRLSALMQQKVIYVLTHDSIGLGEDGPTHQPVETLAQLRALPGLTVIRPGDPVEVAEAWHAALSASGPSAIVLSRQKVPLLRYGALDHGGAMRGGYVLAEAAGGARDVTLIGTGSEVSLAVEARNILAKDGIRAAVVSLPSFELFNAQPDAWRRSVLGSDHVPRVAVEAALRFGWDGIIGRDGGFVGMTGYGASAPASELYQHFNITAQAVAQAARGCLTKKLGEPA